MNQRIEKIRQLEGLFNGNKIDKRSKEPFTVFKTTRNGKLVEPAEMTEKDFDIYLEGLKTKHRNILVFNTEMQD